MSPIDDELRALLSSRASGVDPAPDPLGGIESKARGLRRRRVLTSVSGAAAVVVAVAVAVPLLVSGSGTTAVHQPGDTSTTPTVAADSAALDPSHPWAQRGDSLPLDEKDQCECTPLFVQGSGFNAHDVYGVSTDPAKPGLVYTYTMPSVELMNAHPVVTPYPADMRVLTWTRPGDPGRGKLVVVSAPAAVVDYSAEGDGWQQISDVGQAPKGVGLVPIEAEAPHDKVRVTEADGTVITQDAPDWTSPDTSTPSNLLTTWVHRGGTQRLSSSAVVHAFEQAEGASGGGHYRSLYDGSQLGVGFTIGQAWLDGQPARLVSLRSDNEFFLGPVTPRDPWVLAAVLSTKAAVGTDMLIVLPRPGAGRVGYSPDATTPFADIASGRSQEMEVGIVDRDARATTDRVQVHRGDDSIAVTVGVAQLTCGAKECG